MKNSLSRVVAGSVLAIGALATGSASAQSTWSLVMENPVSAPGCTTAANGFGNSITCSATPGGTAGTTATVNAWSTERTGGTGNVNNLTGTGWANASLTNQGSNGLGVSNRLENFAGAPDHSIDSIAPGKYDFVMVNFGSAVILDQFRIGWGAADSDITVMRWTGSSAPTTTAGVTSVGGNLNLTSTIGAGGWQLVNSFADVCRSSTNTALTGSSNSCDATNSTRSTGATVGSSYWLISAFNTTMSSTSCRTAAGGTTTCDADNDGFKLNWLRTTAYTCPGGVTPGPGGGCGGGGSVPEPGTLALVALASLGVVGLRRRRQNAA